MRKQRWAFCRSALEGAPPRCSAAVYDNVCMFTALIVISVLTGASRHITLALPLGRPLKIPADSALKIFAFIYSVGVSEFDILVFFSAVFISSQKRTLKNRFLYVFVPQTNSVHYKSAIRGKILKKKKVQQFWQNNFYLFKKFAVFLEYLLIQLSRFKISDTGENRN